MLKVTRKDKRKKILKVVSINMGVFVFLVGVIEASSFLLLKCRGYNPKLGYEYKKSLADSCQIMTGHPILGHTHKEEKECNIDGGIKVGNSYVIYKGNHNEKDIIITLGGSTTDGYYNHINKGKTWPYYLSKKLEKRMVNMAILNGGVGGYSSQKEMLKLLLSMDNIAKHKNIRYIISLNGINEMPGYDYGKNYLSQGDLPYWTKEQIFMYKNKKFLNVDSDSRSPHVLLPSLMDTIKKISEKANEEIKREPQDFLRNYKAFYSKKEESKVAYSDAIQQAGEIWQNNIERMYSLSRTIGAQYYVFLQPTMGLEATQIPQQGNSNDRKLYDSISNIYKKRINALYKEWKNRCGKIQYCIDISDEVGPSGDVYNDPRHHNKKGNKILANVIFNELSKRQKV